MSKGGLSEERPLWIYLKQDSKWTQKIIDEFNIHPITAQVLASRKFSSLDQIHNFLYAKLPDLHDPELLPNMEKATLRILKALKKKEKILIYGDNDVDGITGTALLVEFFGHLEVPVLSYFSSRRSLNQPLFSEAIEYALQSNCTLLITVDYGVTAAREIKEATEKNIDVIVSDHHEPTSELPQCVAIINPKLTGSLYPDREITGVGVAFKLAHALTNRLIKEGFLMKSAIDLKKYLDLVVLGTIADMGALLGENRILIRYGLRELRNTKRTGLLKLSQLLGIPLHEITPTEVASKIAPRINSLGRIADASKGVQILLCQDLFLGEILAKEIEQYNQERRRIERKNSEDIDLYLSNHPEIFQNKALVLSSPKWHPGVIPIIAARLAKQYNRPTVLIATDREMGKGSLRTIPEFPLLPTLKEEASLLMEFGGHNYAAGLMIKLNNIASFKEQFIQLVNQKLKDRDIRTKLHLNAKISFNNLTFDFLESLYLLEPFGNENGAPLFYCDVKQIWPPKIFGKSHLKLYLEQNNRILEGVAFGLAKRYPELIKKNLLLRIAFTPYLNRTLHRPKIQLYIKDFKIKPR